MDNEKNIVLDRRNLITGLGAVAATGLVSNTASAASAVDFKPARHELDSWMDEVPGNHRVFIDTSTAQGGADALRYAFNIYNAHEEAYPGKSADMAMIVCYRHASTPFAFNDSIWEKYGELFHRRMQYLDPATGQAPKVNLMNVSSGFGAGSTIDALVERGLQFAVCSAATRGLSFLVASETDLSAEEAYEELVGAAIPNSHFVSAGVMGMTRAQEYSYSLLYAG